MFPISPNVTHQLMHQPLPYHEVSAACLPSVTSIGLQAAGIPIERGPRSSGGFEADFIIVLQVFVLRAGIYASKSLQKLV